VIRRTLLQAIAQRRLVLATVAALAAAALWQARGLRLDALPDVTGNQVVILTRAPGFTPSEVERLVTRPVEVALGGLPGLDGQRSISRYGLSAVTAVFEEDVDLVRARQLTQERLTTLGALPEGVEPPEMGPLTGGLGEIFHFTLTSGQRTPADVLELVDLRIAPLLRSVPGVVEVNTWGGHVRTLDVVADVEALAARGIGFEELREGVTRATGNAAGDSLDAGRARLLLRGRALPTTEAELGAAIVRRDAHGVVRVADVARVCAGGLPRLGAATADARGETVYVMVQMVRDANALQVTHAIHERMGAVRSALPDDVRLEVVYDRSELVEATLETVGTNLLEGGALVIVVLFVMLGSGRAGAIVALTIPLSMLGALVGMVAFEIPGNLMSLGAIDFGLLVDGAVVLVESGFHHFERSRDDDPVTTIRRAASEVARPVFFSVAIILLVYLPILTLRGVDGKMFGPMAMTVVLALGTALILTMTFVPAATATFLRPRHVPPKPSLLARALRRLHTPVLARAARHPRLVGVVALGALVAAVVLFSRAGVAFVPQLDEGDLVVQTTRSASVSIDTAVADAGRLEAALADVPEVLHVSSRIGSPAVATDVMGLEQADVFVRIAPRSEWREGLDRDGLIEELAERIEADAPGSDPAFTQPIQMRFNELVGGDVSDVSISVYGPELDGLAAIAADIEERLSGLEGATDVRIQSPPDVPLADVRPDPLRAAMHGLDTRDVLDAVRAFRVGLPAGTTYDGARAIPIRVRLETPSAFTLEDAPLPTPAGVVPLDAVATVEVVPSPSLVNHDDAERRVVVGFNVRGRDLGSVVEDARAALSDLPLPEGHRLRWGGQLETLRDAQRRLAVVIPLALGGIAALLLLLFRRIRPVWIIGLHVPFAALGGIVALTVRDLPVSISAAIGFVALSGIAVLNGVVLVSRIEQRAADGESLRAAALEAARERMRPVMTTALVAALGFVPMAVATGVGAEVQRPLATVVVGGLVTSTLLTLLVLPVLYPWLAGRGRPRNP